MGLFGKKKDKKALSKNYPIFVKKLMDYPKLAEKLITVANCLSGSKVSPLIKLLNYCASTDLKGNMILDPQILTYCKVKIVSRMQQDCLDCCPQKFLNNEIANRSLKFNTEDQFLDLKLNQTLNELEKIHNKSKFICHFEELQVDETLFCGQQNQNKC